MDLLNLSLILSIVFVDNLILGFFVAFLIALSSFSFIHKGFSQNTCLFDLIESIT